MRVILTFLAPTFLAISFLAVPAAAQPVSIDDVRAMAFDKGIVKIEEVELDDGIWKVRAKHSTSPRFAAGGYRSINLFFAAIEAYIGTAGASRLWR